MKRKLFLFTVAAFFAFYSCKKDNGGGDGTTLPNVDKDVAAALNSNYSNNTDEQNKDNPVGY